MVMHDADRNPKEFLLCVGGRVGDTDRHSNGSGFERGGLTTGQIMRIADLLVKTHGVDVAQAMMDKVMNDDNFRPLLQRLTEYLDGARTEDAVWRVV
jgi:hypothetical protein